MYILIAVSVLRFIVGRIRSRDAALCSVERGGLWPFGFGGSAVLLRFAGGSIVEAPSFVSLSLSIFNFLNL